MKISSHRDVNLHAARKGRDRQRPRVRLKSTGLVAVHKSSRQAIQRENLCPDWVIPDLALRDLSRIGNRGQGEKRPEERKEETRNSSMLQPALTGYRFSVKDRRRSALVPSY